jgi:hypothetical protein
MARAEANSIEANQERDTMIITCPIARAAILLHKRANQGPQDLKARRAAALEEFGAVLAEGGAAALTWLIDNAHRLECPRVAHARAMAAQ